MANLVQVLIRERNSIPNLIFLGTGVLTFFGLFNGAIFLRLIYSDVIKIHADTKVQGTQVQGYKKILRNSISLQCHINKVGLGDFLIHTRP